MALIEFFGCFLLAFGPPLSMYVITVAKDPIRVIVLVTRFNLKFNIDQFYQNLI